MNLWLKCSEDVGDCSKMCDSWTTATGNCMFFWRFAPNHNQLVDHFSETWLQVWADLSRRCGGLGIFSLFPCSGSRCSYLPSCSNLESLAKMTWKSGKITVSKTIQNASKHRSFDFHLELLASFLWRMIPASSANLPIRQHLEFEAPKM